ncbi:PP2C family serine/threonine-protein phosphatase [Amycolatopsis sp. NPDC059657]|uniref:PP2C family serine/threonine-protein phosphatase n=1 Tax=Amycolatopsis sp. NPDC059657 TaxID=3346899 RepID=UPI00366BBD5E
MIHCPHCAAPAQPDWQFCEECGKQLGELIAAEPTMRFSPGDEGVLDLGAVAGVTDIGLRRPRNEDAVAVGTQGPVLAAVICDGVATSAHSETAAGLGVSEGLRALLDACAKGEPPGSATATGLIAAASAVAALGTPGDRNPPCCTYVSALFHEGSVVIGWVGDSPAYWIGPAGAHRLTVDDSAAGRLIAEGVSPDDPRFATPMAHALERWLGADAGPVTPKVHRFVPDSSGLVVICSDGLSQYLDAKVVAPVDHLSTPSTAVRLLLGRALGAGGGDNISVAALACPATEEDA